QGELGFTFRPAAQFRIDHTFLYERLATRLGAPVFTDRILREKLNYQFTRELSLRAIVDYSIVRRDSTLSRVDPEHRWAVDLLLTYLVNPGTALYVGYRDGYENLAILPGTPPALYRTEDPTTSVGRQLFLKLSYLLQFYRRSLRRSRASARSSGFGWARAASVTAGIPIPPGR